MAGGQSHLYRMTLSIGQCVQVIVKQDGLDVIVLVKGPDGGRILTADTERRPEGLESISIVTEVAGDYQVILQPAVERGPAGHYQIWIQDLRPATENDRALFDAWKQYEQANKLRDAGRYHEALPLYKNLIETFQRILGANDRNFALALHDLAVFYYYKGDDLRSEPLSQRARAIQEQILGRESTDLAASLNLLGLICANRGEFAKAEPLFQRAVAIKQKALGEEHPNLAFYLYNLAHIYSNKGDYAQAQPLYERTLAIREKMLEPEHPLVTQSLSELAAMHYKRGDLAKAESLYQRALTSWERLLGPEHPNVAESLNGLANIYRDRQEYAKAEPLYRRALAIREKTELPVLAVTLKSLARLYFERGEYAKAEPLLQRALALFEKLLGGKHLYVASTLSDLAVLYAGQGQFTEAIRLQSQANAVREHNLALNLSTGSERQKLAYLANFSKTVDFTLSLQSQAAPQDPQAIDLAFTTWLRWKGRGLDAMSGAIAALRRRAAPQDQILFDQLAEARSQLSALRLRDVAEETPASSPDRLRGLEEEIEKLERKLCSRSTKFGTQVQPVTISAVQAALPANSTLIEFAVHTPQKLANGQNQPQRYLVYLLAAQGRPKWIDLGEIAPIDRAVNAWRLALRDPNRTDVNQRARVVYEKVMRPLLPLLGETQHLLIAPDGLLNLIPFAALVNERNQFLVERYSISYLTSGRDLLRSRESPPSNNPPLIVANPDFGRVETARARDGQPAGNSPAGDQEWGQIDSTRIFFQTLPGTELEALEIKAAIPNASTLLREQATETALKQSKAPRLLHIATHGFFLDHQESPRTERRNLPNDTLRRSFRLSRQAAKIENPLLRSGLALAGANQRPGAEDDGVLTAMEVASLDLWGTQLVVLSGCDTGIGEVRNGEGVYGLRRALVLAGAETQIMSLWPISDRETRRLIVGYYRRLLKGEGRGEALRQIQLEKLKNTRLRHPYYWASFIQAGKWADLDGTVSGDSEYRSHEVSK
ncbi:MAG TPA: CHAT domain-containing tetratricopeptide repeat protein [Blastocatellia bacterium]|nr:CHAT domain-containing tetratricopeptide repeat protein [Blastocatellia bacterium]